MTNFLNEGEFKVVERDRERYLSLYDTLKRVKWLNIGEEMTIERLKLRK